MSSAHYECNDGHGFNAPDLGSSRRCLYCNRAAYRCDSRSGKRYVYALAAAAMLAACTPAPIIQPVRYQPVDVLVVKPCLAGRKLPEPALQLTEPACTKSAAECVRDAAADLNELKREARESRNLLKECSR